MKAKVIAGIMSTLLLVGMAMYAIPTGRAVGDPLVIGVVGPMLWIQGQGMEEGATLAAERVNDMGGVYYAGEYHLIEIVTANTGPGGAEPTYEDGVAAVTSVAGQGAQFIIGFFRSEAAFGGRWKAHDLGLPLTITGAGTTELINCGGKYDPDGPLGPTPPGPCGDCVYCTPAEYPGLFRVTPPNSSTLLRAPATYYQAGLLGPWLTMSQRGGVYLDNDKNYVVTVGDLRLSSVTVDGTTYPAYTPVLPGDLDITDPLVPIPGPAGPLTKAFASWDPTYPIKISPYYGLYMDLDASNTVSAGDIRRVPILIPEYQPGSIWPPEYVDAGDLDAVLGLGLSPFPQVSYAAIVENAVWADVIWDYFTAAPVYPALMGPYGRYDFGGRPSPDATTFDAELTGIIDNDCKLIVHIFSAEAGLAFMIQWAAWGSPGVPIGIDVLGQEGTHWDNTAGACEGEAFLASTGTRTPMWAAGDDGWGRYGNIGTVGFWDAYITRYGHEPIYTSWGAHDSIIGLAETIERVGTINYATVAAETEQTDRQGLLGRFTFTGPGGTSHDVLSTELSSTWLEGKVRPVIVQWQAGRKEIIWPTTGNPAPLAYAKLFWLPPGLYPWRADVNLDGIVDIYDALWVRGTYGSEPGDADWQSAADCVTTGASHWLIDIFDALLVRKDYLKTVPYPT